MIADSGDVGGFTDGMADAKAQVATKGAGEGFIVGWDAMMWAG